VKEVKIVIVIN